MLHLMYITNSPEVAKIAENAGVDWIFVDMEFIGKDFRQRGMDTVQNHHTVSDVRTIKSAVTKAKVLVRINPIHEALEDYPSTMDEIDAVINAGADIIMLPYFKTVEEVRTFIDSVNGRTKTCLLLETPEAAALLQQIVEIPGIDMIHIGLNDMHLAMGMKFMFQLLADGSVDRWSKVIKERSIPFGFGGLASLDGGAVPGRMVLKEHYRLGSSMVIVSRSFCNTDKMTDLGVINNTFTLGVSKIRDLEKTLSFESVENLEMNRQSVCRAVENIVKHS